MQPSASRTTLPIKECDECAIDGEDGEDDEEDGISPVDDRKTVASSKASIRSSYSMTDRQLDIIHQHSVVSKKSTPNSPIPTAEKLADSAKNFFNIHRPQSVLARVTSSSCANDAAARLETGAESLPASSPDRAATDNLASAVQITATGNDVGGVSELNENPQISVSSPQSPRYFTRPILPRMRTSTTITSSFDVTRAPSRNSSRRETGTLDEEEAVFDTSSKQRVQSWTDRILYKSTIKTVTELQQEADAREQAERESRHLGSVLLDSLRGVRRTLTGHGNEPSATTSPAIDVDVKRKLLSRVTSFSESHQRNDKRGLAPSTTVISALPSASQVSLCDDVASRSNHRVRQRLGKLFRRNSSDLQVELSESRGTQRKSVDDVNLQRRASSSHRNGPFLSSGLRRSTSVRSTASMHAKDAPGAHTQPPYRPLPSTNTLVSNSALNAGRVDTIALQRSAHVEGSSPIPETGGWVDGQTNGVDDDASSLVPSPGALTGDGVCQDTIIHNRRSTTPLPSYDHKQTDTVHSAHPVASDTRPLPTRITLAHASTVPVRTMGMSPEHNEVGGGALRQWWNSHNLHIPFFAHHNQPSISASLADESCTPPSMPSNLSEPLDIAVTLPRLVGPERGEVQCLSYQSIHDLVRMQALSDHHPVVATFAVGL